MSDRQIVAGVRAELEHIEPDFRQMIARLDEAAAHLATVADALARASDHARQIEAAEQRQIEALLQQARTLRRAIETEAHPF